MQGDPTGYRPTSTSEYPFPGQQKGQTAQDQGQKEKAGDLQDSKATGEDKDLEIGQPEGETMIDKEDVEPKGVWGYLKGLFHFMQYEDLPPMNDSSYDDFVYL